MKRVGLIALAAAGMLALSGCGAKEAAVAPDTIKVQNVVGDRIVVAAREEVRVEPDMAQIVYGIHTQDKDAAVCQEKNSQDLEKTIAVLKDLGVAEKSIQTSSFGMNPIYNWDSGKQEITGYEMDTQVTVSDVPIDQAGTIMTKSVQSGVNSIQTVTYFSSKYDESYQEALKKAMEASKVKAQAIAEAGGRTLGPAVHVVEADGQQARYTGYENASRKQAVQETAAAAGDMAVMPGEVSVEARITVEFEIQ